ncbi:NAD(P)-binding protein [Mollisia scopiformis]|uniref:NAD(P)-binding protein n=1 Tax=Mollisia scopiformis TaxID=149040 RepID=A0A194XKC8_MOLSC|nr:NAD(P)-binding protein [Mollisia scopiformis]KUJ20596.1 NAD(P)-binding protein [Mollisia scopiformis]
MASSYEKITRWNYHSTGQEVVQAFPDKVKDKTILITGPSSGGIGAATALALAAGSPHLLLLTGRSEAKITPVIQDINQKYANVDVRFVHCDLAAQSSVRSASVEILKILGDKGLDILICNAAIMACPFALTPDGIESQFGTNHIGHFLLVNLLFPQVLKAERPRIVMVSSSAHRSGVVRFDDLNFDGDGEKGEGKAYNAWEGYGQSKLANILFAKSLARIFESKDMQAKAYSLHPGSIRTGLQVHMLAASETLLAEGLAKAIAAEAKHGRVFKREAPKTLEQGCSTTLVAALDPSIDSMSGVYLVNGDVAEYPPEEGSVTIEDQDRLWILSERLVGEKFNW